MKILYSLLIVCAVLETSSIVYGSASQKNLQEIFQCVRRDIVGGIPGPISYIAYVQGTVQCSRWPLENKTICNSALFRPFAPHPDLGYPKDYMVGDLPDILFEEMKTCYEAQEKNKKTSK